LSEAVHPFVALVTVTVYVFVEPGVILVDAVLAELLQEYVPPPVAVSVADCPEQIVWSVPALAEGGEVLDVITTLSVAVHPPVVFVTVSVYVPGWLTTGLMVVAPETILPPPEAVQLYV
jgi:hypothetical protein